MSESVLVCSARYGGCGKVALGIEFRNVDFEGHILSCPSCQEDHAFQVTSENLKQFEDEPNFEEIKRLLKLHS